MNPDVDVMTMLRAANNAVRGGADPAAVDLRISEATGGQIPSLAALGEAARQSQAAAPVDETLAAQERHLGRGGNAVGDFARMAAQGATFGFADEITGLAAGAIPGGMNREEATAASRERISDLRTLAPGASAMAEAAGGLAVPFMSGAGVARNVAKPGASLLVRAAGGAAGGAVAGGLSGALIGAGEAEGGAIDRIPSAARGAAVGTVAGAATGGALTLGGAAIGSGGRFMGEVLNPQAQAGRESRRRLGQVFREAEVAPGSIEGRMERLGPDAVHADMDPRLAREARTARNQAAALDRAGGPVEAISERAQARGDRLAAQLRETSGITQTMDEGQDLAEMALQEVRENHYWPLQEAFSSVEGRNVQTALQDPRVAAVARRTAPDVASGQRPPSFTELQDIMMDLRDDVTAARASGRPNRAGKAQDAFDTIVDAMSEDIPGFADAQRAFRVASKKLEGYQGGYDAWTRSARVIRQRMDELPPEAHDSFRVGLLQRWEEKLLAKEGTTGAVNSILRAGEEMREQIRAAFGSDEAFSAFLQQRDLERTFRMTEAALGGNSTTVQQAMDVASAAPKGRTELISRMYEAVLSPGDSRRIQGQIVGEQLLGRDTGTLLDMLEPNRFGVGQTGAGGGLGGVAGSESARQGRDDQMRARADTLRRGVGRDLQGGAR